MIELGQTVGNYVVQAKLGEGGMGAVFLVEHPVIGRKAALKAIHPQFSKNLEVVSRFITEAKSISEIGHEHIVEVTDFGNMADGDFYFIMEYLDGRSIADTVAKDGRMPPERALPIAIQIADALQASHDHGVIHRDLKPDNIFLVAHGDDSDFVKVLDFGLAKLVGTEHLGRPKHNTRSGSVFGTPCYMAPEQCEGKVQIDHRADIYSLGVILFELLTGKVPFGGTGFGEIIVKHMTVQPPAVRSIVPELPVALDVILFRALAKDPAHRFQSMAELRAALLDPDGYAAGLPHFGTDDDLSGRFQAAGPMARTELNLRPMTPSATVVDSPMLATAAATPLPRSTFESGAGEISRLHVAADAIPRSHHGRKLALAAMVAAAVAVYATAAYERPLAGVTAAARAMRRPSKVRLNFGSDPDGAIVIRGDGIVLGTTPLSTEVPYADVATEYTVRKAGYVSKSVALVPNLPSPVFAVLQPLEPVAAPTVVSSNHEPTPAPTSEPAMPRAPRRPAHAPRRPSEPATAFHGADPIDEDGVLAPTIR